MVRNKISPILNKYGNTCIQRWSWINNILEWMEASLILLSPNDQVGQGTK